MPLVVPGMQSNDGGKTTEWMNKLMGKKLGDSHNETVSFYFAVRLRALADLICLRRLRRRISQRSTACSRAIV